MFCIAFFRAMAATMLTVFFDALRIALFESAIAAANDDTTLTFIFLASKKNAAVELRRRGAFMPSMRKGKQQSRFQNIRQEFFFVKDKKARYKKKS